MKILQPLLQVIASSIQNYFGVKTKVGFDGNCLKQDKITNNHGKVVNIYTVYEISRNINISNYPIIENCLFGAVSLTKMLALIRISILDMELDLIDMDFIGILKN